LILVPVILLATTGPALAKYRIKAPAPTRSDFRRALVKSKAVERQVPIRLRATSRPQVKTVVKDGIVHEKGTVIANASYDTFIRRMDPANWSKNLPQRWGGQVVRIKDRRRQGLGTVLQQERMVLGIPALDMTKNTVVHVGKDRARIRWEVTHSDRSLPTLGRKTVKMDNGWIEFSRTADNRVKIVTRSAHKITTAPSVPIEKLAPNTANKLFAASLRSYFKSTVKRYQAIAEGRRSAK
jgi:hypothetical protein